jgi:uncharacterized protein
MLQQAFKPLAQRGRIQTIDILRGIALLGILLVNIPYFGIPDYFQWSFNQDPKGMGYWLMMMVNILFEGKMKAMLSIIFGGCILLFTFGKEKKGQTATRLFYRRMFWLVLSGLAGACLLLWKGDILYFYGIIGMLAYFFRHLPKRYLLLVIPLVALFAIANNLYSNYSLHTARLAYNQVAAKEHQRLPLKKSDLNSKQKYIDAEKMYLPILKDNISYLGRPEIGAYQLTSLLAGICDHVGLMLLGMALFKSAFLTAKRSTKLYINMAAIGYFVGLPLSAYSYLYGLQKYHSSEAIIRFLETSWFDLTPAAYEIQRMALVLAHLSILILLIRSRFTKKLADRLGALGQMAFTNYTLQTVICALLFSRYGFGLSGRLKYAELFYVVAGVWALQLYLSQLWLNYYNFGPLEWAWRCLTYGRLLPFRKLEEQLLVIIPVDPLETEDADDQEQGLTRF